MKINTELSEESPLEKAGSILPNNLSSKNYQALFESAPIGIVLSDISGVLLKVNNAVCQMLGYSEKELIGKNLKEISHPEDMTTNMAHREKLIAGEVDSFHMDKRYIHKDGHIVWGRLTVSNLEFNDDQEPYLMAHLEDITSSKITENALRQSEDKYKKLIEIANDAIFIIDSETREIVEVNKMATKIIGSPRKKIVGSLFSDLFYIDSLEFTSKEIEKLIEDRGGHIREVMLKNSKNMLIPVELSSSPVKIDKKNFIQSIARDMSDRHRTYELRKALDNINESIHSTLDFKEIMKRLVDEACQTLGDTVGIFIKDDRYWIAEYFVGSLSNIQGIHFTEDEIKVATLAENSRQTIVSNDTLIDDRFNKDLMEISKMRSILLVPLLIKEQVIGALCIAYSKEAIPFSESEIDFGVKLGSTVSLAIENAKMYGSEQLIANTLQEALLEMPPRIKGIEFGHLYKSSTEVARVGGDFFDIFEIDDDVVAILIGDVSGKGLGAASLTSKVKNTIRAYLEIERSPSRLAKMTSNLICKTQGGSMYVSLFFGLLSRKNGTLIYCCAGHPPPVVMSSVNEKADFLDSTSTVLGQFSSMNFEESEITLSKTDTLLAYTDGLTDLRRDEEFFGEKRLLKTALKNNKKETNDLPLLIFNESKEFAQGKLLDDIAILAVSLKNDV